jgi:TRAP-type C4-dicarboxylate transport system permease small subunit
MAVLAALVVHITVDVLARVLIGQSLPGTIAFVSNYYMIAIIFLPLVVAERELKHIDVEVVTQTLPTALQAILRLFAWLLTAGAFMLLGYESLSNAIHAYKVGIFIVEQGYRIPTWISYFMLPLGYFSAAGVALTRIGTALVNLKTGMITSVKHAETFLDRSDIRIIQAGDTFLEEDR